MAVTCNFWILKILENLTKEDLKLFHFYLNEYNKSKHKPISQSKLEGKDRTDTAKLLTEHYGNQEALQVTVQTLKAINQHNLACQLEQNLSK
uniref:Pyrin domain-containing protein n=1 Tax=Amphilophus citrinellus TaxID=61819 RepID=A0A3Q0R9F8_AMPCI